MKELNLPHLAPIRFAKYTISKEEKSAVVRVEFDSIPSLAMLVEAAAQSSAAFDQGDGKMGFLVTLKNIKLLQEPKSLTYDVTVSSDHEMGQLTYFNFQTYDKDELIATGVFIVSLQ